MAEAGTIRVGVGGWDFDPWRESFYPPKLPKAKQLEFMGSQLTATEINATYYKLQKPELFAKWRDMVPEGFRFAVKGSRYCTNKKVLGEAAEGVARVFAQGLAALRGKLRPLLLLFMHFQRFDAHHFAAF